MNTLTPMQQKAVATIDDHLQIIACAGSGKTRVVTDRIIHILQQKTEINPRNLVAFTFTEKAANELKDRIFSTARTKLGNIVGMSELYVGTIHGFCKKLLDEYAPEYEKYTVLDAIQTKIFIDRHYDKIGMTKIRKIKDDSVMRPYQDTYHFMQIMNMVRESGCTPDELPENIQEAVRMYNATFDEHAFLDFTMIMERAIRLIKENPAVQQKISERIRYLTVDEYQDVNPIQETLIRLLVDLGANLCVVGDDDQVLYRWRGSEIQNILTFDERYPNPVTVFLTDNFRSTKGVVDLAHSVINHNVNRKKKQMIASGSLQHEEGDLLYQEFQDEQDEYDFIVNRIRDLHALGVPYHEMVILMRVKKIGRNIMATLNQAGIPFVVEGINELFTTPEIEASCKLFQYLNRFNPKKATSSPTAKKDDLIAAWKSIGYPVDDRRLDQAIAQLEKWNPGNYTFYPDYILQHIFQEFLSELELTEPEGTPNPILENIYYNLAKFSQVIHDFEVIHFRSVPSSKLKNFCSFLVFTANGQYPEGQLGNPHRNQHGVRMMTIHQAKGLQYAAVFVPGLCQNIFPAGKQGGLQPWHFLPDHLNERFSQYRHNDVEDERRLFYVAATRAKKFLYLTRAEYQTIRRGQNKKPSPFLEEAKRCRYIFQNDEQIPVDYTKRERYVSDVPDIMPITLTFSHLKDYYGCQYRFKLSFVYGFIQPIAPTMGYGKSLHGMVAEINQLVKEKAVLSTDVVDAIVDRHFHLPYASQPMIENMKAAATTSIHEYVNVNREALETVEYVEQDVEFDLGDGVRVAGRMDLVKRDEKISIVDYKTEHRVDSENVTHDQLSF